MTTFAPPESTLNELRDQVMMLTGGSGGIGAAIVRLLHSLGALVVIGDIDADNANKLIASLPDTPYPRSNVTFVNTDVTSYSSNLKLFEYAESKYGHIDHALAVAGVAERGDWFGPSLDRESVKDCPTTLTLDINLTGVLYFSRIAFAFLSDPKTRTEGQDRSLTIMASSTSFRPHASALYGTSKHGVLGLAKSLHAGAGKARGIRVNTVMPWLVGSTNILPGRDTAWRQAGLMLNEPEDVARVTRELVASPGLSGKAIYIVEGKAWDILESMESTTDVWWGPGLKEAYDEDERKLFALRDCEKQQGKANNGPA